MNWNPICATTWNSKCGIASYSRFVLDNLPAGVFETTVFASRRDSLIRPDEPNDVGPIHADGWFWAYGNGGNATSPSGYDRFNIWIAL